MANSSRAPRSPRDKVGGLFHFARMIDKIRLHASGELDPQYHENLGIGFDGSCTEFLHIDYSKLVERVKQGGSDEEILEWCFQNGRRPSKNEIRMWNEYMRKVGLHDRATERLEGRKVESNLSDRADIITMFQYIDADEGRPVAPP